MTVAAHEPTSGVTITANPSGESADLIWCNNEIGSFKSVRWIMADELEKMSTIEQQVEFKMYMFLKGN